MSVPTNKELMERFAKIQAAESKTLKESPEDNDGFQAGKPAGVLSKDDHSKPVSRKNDPGVKDAPKEYDAKDKKLDTDGGNKRDAGADKAQDKFEGSEKAASDTTKDERKENALGKAPVAKGAEKEFAKFRDRIRAKMGLDLGDKLNQGNDGKIH
jgi:hypothetical protein